MHMIKITSQGSSHSGLGFKRRTRVSRHSTLEEKLLEGGESREFPSPWILSVPVMSVKGSINPWVYPDVRLPQNILARDHNRRHKLLLLAPNHLNSGSFIHEGSVNIELLNLTFRPGRGGLPDSDSFFPPDSIPKSSAVNRPSNAPMLDWPAFSSAA